MLVILFLFVGEAVDEKVASDDLSKSLDSIV